MSRRVLRNLAFCALLGAGIAACGQRGPLVLPESARPVQRIEPQPTPAAQTPAPEKQDDEQKKNER